MKVLLASIACLLLVPVAGAASKTNMSARVCTSVVTMQSETPVQPSATIIPRVYVNGRMLQARPVGPQSARWTGRGVVAQLWQSKRYAPLIFRVASVRGNCVTVRLNYALR